MSLAYQIWIKQWTTLMDTIGVVDMSSSIVLDDSGSNPLLNLITGEYYKIVFNTGYEGVFRSVSSTAGLDNEYVFAWNNMPLDFDSPVTAAIYQNSYSKTTVTDVDIQGKVSEEVKIENYFVSIEQSVDSNVLFRGDAYTLINDNYCDNTEFILFVRKQCTSGWREFELIFKVADLIFDTQACVITGKDSPTPLNTKTLLAKEFDVITTASTFYSITDSVYTTLNASLLRNYFIKFERLLWFNTVVEYLIQQSRLPVSGFRSILLNVNNPADYTYTQVDTYVDYGDYYYLMMASLSDMVKPSASNVAKRLEVSLMGLLSNLCKMYNGLYFIDDDGYLRLEHWEYFENAGVRVFDTDTFTVSEYETLDEPPPAIKYTYKFNFPYQDPFATPGNPSYAHGSGVVDYNKHHISDRDDILTVFDRSRTVADGTRLRDSGKRKKVISPTGFRYIAVDPIFVKVFKTIQDPITLRGFAEDVVIENVGTDGYALCLFNSPTITTYTDNVWKGEAKDYFLCLIRGTNSSAPDAGAASVTGNEYMNDYLGWDYLLPQYHRHRQYYAEAWYPPDSDLVSVASITPTPRLPLIPTTNNYTFTTQEYTQNQLLLPYSLAPDSSFVANVTNCCPPDLGVMDYILTDKGRARITKIVTDLYTGDAEIETELRIC